MPYYTVVKGRTNGIFTTWSLCQESVKGYSGALFKKFDTKEEAEMFIESSNECHKEISVDYYVYTDGACSYTF